MRILTARARTIGAHVQKGIDFTLGYDNRHITHVDLVDFLGQLFDFIDADRSGEISVDEWIVFVRQVCPTWSKKRASALFDLIDSDGEGTVDVTEFLDVAAQV